MVVILALYKTNLTELGFSKKYLTQHLVLGLIAGGILLFSLPLLETGLKSTGLIDHELFGEKSQHHDLNSLSLLPEQLTTLVFIPLIEQIFFTGIILQSLLKKMNAITAVYTSSLIYTLAGFKLTLGTFGLGIGASSLYKLTGTLYASILFHISCALGGILLENIYPKIRIILGFLY
jgi:membrane protease YdiL (CAAX protease family)